jgi:hypothetical protein
MGVEALFWFHPLVWWLGARLMEERERACDEEVLLMGAYIASSLSRLRRSGPQVGIYACCRS